MDHNKHMSWFEDDMISGIVSGVSAGIVLAVFFGTIDRFRAHTKKRDQIRYVSNLIADFRGKILEVHEDVPHPMGGDSITMHQLRKVLYDDLLKQLDSALSGRTSELTYNQVESVRSVFWGAYHKLLSDKLWPEELYVRTFKEAESIKWLRLSPYDSKA